MAKAMPFQRNLVKPEFLMLTTQNGTTTELDLTWVRSQFPSLAQTVNGNPAVFLDGPGGTQVPQRVIDAISDYLTHDRTPTPAAPMPPAAARTPSSMTPAPPWQIFWVAILTKSSSVPT